eukprot:1188040-Prorocentrum_minimum.AAC.2
MNFIAASEATPSFGLNPSGSIRQPGETPKGPNSELLTIPRSLLRVQRIGNTSPERGDGVHCGTAKGPLGFRSSAPMAVKARGEEGVRRG